MCLAVVQETPIDEPTAVAGLRFLKTRAWCVDLADSGMSVFDASKDGSIGFANTHGRVAEVL